MNLPVVNNISLAKGTEQEMLARMGKDLPSQLLVKVPEVVYQIMWDIAQSYQGGQSDDERLRYRQIAIFKALKEWAAEAYPSYGIVNFIDFNNQEAEAMNRKIYQNKLGNGTVSDFRVEWGMYVLLGRNATTDLSTDINNLLTSPSKQLDYGNSQEDSS